MNGKITLVRGIRPDIHPPVLGEVEYEDGRKMVSDRDSVRLLGKDGAVVGYLGLDDFQREVERWDGKP